MTKFIESQKFNQLWIKLVIILDIVIMGAVIWWVFFQSGMGEDMMTMIIIGGVSVISFLMLPLLFFSCKLKVELTDEAIVYQFFPFHMQTKKILFKDIKEAFAREYSPIKEYGGWGLRFGLHGKGRAFNVSGNQGVQLVLNDGERILFGTQKPKEFEEALKEKLKA